MRCPISLFFLEIEEKKQVFVCATGVNNSSAATTNALIRINFPQARNLRDRVRENMVATVFDSEKFAIIIAPWLQEAGCPTFK
jgi:hypothetical protein